MNYRQVIKLLKEDGWEPKKGKKKGGSHRQFVHPTKSGKVTVAFHGDTEEIPVGTLNSILKQAGLK